MQLTVKLDVKPVGTYYGQLATVLRQSLPRTLKYEAAATVRKAMSFVKSSKISDVKAKALRSGVASFRENDAGFGGTTSVGKRAKQFGRQWMVGRRGGTVMPMSLWSGGLGPLQDHTGYGWRAPDGDWSRFKSLWSKNAIKVKESIKARAGARGLTAKSWYDILAILNSEQAGMVSSFVQRARPISGKTRQVGFSMELGSGSTQPQVTITNTSGIAIATGGDRKLQSAITIRRKFFMDSFDKGFISDAKFVARNYPWAKVT